MNDNMLIADINEAVYVITTYNLSSLVWHFDECPLQEVKNHYVPKGDEEFVCVEEKIYDNYIPYRLFNVSLKPFDLLDAKDFITTLTFHPEYNIYIVHSVKDDD